MPILHSQAKQSKAELMAAEIKFWNECDADMRKYFKFIYISAKTGQPKK